MQDNGQSAEDQGRIARRSALKAGLAGSGAAVVWSAPRLEGMSFAPDYASAATCADQTSTVGLATRDCDGLQVGGCWGNRNNTTPNVSCNCGSLGYNETPFGSINISGTRTGGFNGDDGILNIALNGMTANNFDECTVDVGVSGVQYSGIGNWEFSNSNHIFNTNGSSNNIEIDFDGSFGVYVNSMSALNLTVTCVCDRQP